MTLISSVTIAMYRLVESLYQEALNMGDCEVSSNHRAYSVSSTTPSRLIPAASTVGSVITVRDNRMSAMRINDFMLLATLLRIFHRLDAQNYYTATIYIVYDNTNTHRAVRSIDLL